MYSVEWVEWLYVDSSASVWREWYVTPSTWTRGRLCLVGGARASATVLIFAVHIKRRNKIS